MQHIERAWPRAMTVQHIVRAWPRAMTLQHIVRAWPRAMTFLLAKKRVIFAYDHLTENIFNTLIFLEMYVTYKQDIDVCYDHPCSKSLFDIST